jgi:hypothetical protein
MHATAKIVVLIVGFVLAMSLGKLGAYGGGVWGVFALTAAIYGIACFIGFKLIRPLKRPIADKERERDLRSIRRGFEAHPAIRFVALLAPRCLVRLCHRDRHRLHGTQVETDEPERVELVS